PGGGCAAWPRRAAGGIMTGAGAHGGRRAAETAMHLLYLRLGSGSPVVAMSPTRVGLLPLSRLAMVGFLLAWAIGWYRASVGEGAREEVAMIDPAELMRLRELAEAKRREAQAAQAGGQVPPAP